MLLSLHVTRRTDRGPGRGTLDRGVGSVFLGPRDLDVDTEPWPQAVGRAPAGALAYLAAVEPQCRRVAGTVVVGWLRWIDESDFRPVPPGSTGGPGGTPCRWRGAGCAGRRKPGAWLTGTAWAARPGRAPRLRVRFDVATWFGVSPQGRLQMRVHRIRSPASALPVIMMVMSTTEPAAIRCERLGPMVVRDEGDRAQRFAEEGLALRVLVAAAARRRGRRAPHGGPRPAR